MESVPGLHVCGRLCGVCSNASERRTIGETLFELGLLTCIRAAAGALPRERLLW